MHSSHQPRMFWPFQMRMPLEFLYGKSRNQSIYKLHCLSLVMILKNYSISIESMSHVWEIDWTTVISEVHSWAAHSIPSMMQRNLWAFASMFLRVSMLNSVSSVFLSVQLSPSNGSSLFNSSNIEYSSVLGNWNYLRFFQAILSRIGNSNARAIHVTILQHNDILWPFNLHLSTTRSICSLALYRGEATRSDITSADNYIQHLLWLISPEYKGEPSYRHYTIAMILIFIAISVVVMHVLLFGMMCPFWKQQICLLKFLILFLRGCFVSEKALLNLV
jgi:hypothetical protein